MRRLLGILAIVVVLYTILMVSFPGRFTLDNHQVLAGRLGFYGVLTLGVGLLIISGGIDLSIGSLVGLTAVGFGLLMQRGVPPLAAAGLVIAASAVIGLFHGLLVTGARLQPFLVTLCGLFMYRGLARWLSGETSVGLPREPESFRVAAEQLRWVLVSGDVFRVSNQLLVMLVIATVLAVLLHASVHGRYLYAIGYNEQAARYAGISTNRYKILGYVICSLLAGVGGVLYLLENRSALPSGAGQFLELYAITGAVLGGCSLRGGEGTVVGMILGAAVLPLLAQICTASPYIGSTQEYTVIGAVLLLGTLGSELLQRRSTGRR